MLLTSATTQMRRRECPMGCLSSKVALVTGAASGIGRAIVERFATEGASVLAVDIDSSVAEVSEQAAGDVASFTVDVANTSAVRDMIDEVDRRWGRLDVLCNCAGIGRGGTVLDQSEEDFDRVYAVNVRGPFLATKYGAPLIARGGGGSIVNIASIGGLVAQARTCAYSTSKGAAVMLTRSCAVDLAPLGIRVNAVCPGLIETALLAHVPPEKVQELADRPPLRRLGQPDEIAAMALFLASDESSFSTGSVFVADGGRTAT